jgi:hypothetical protein
LSRRPQSTRRAKPLKQLTRSQVKLTLACAVQCRRIYCFLISSWPLPAAIVGGVRREIAGNGSRIAGSVRVVVGDSFGAGGGSEICFMFCAIIGRSGFEK